MEPLKRSIFLGLFCFLLCGSANADSDALFSPVSNPGDKITGVSWDAKEIPLRIEREGKVERKYVILEGKYNREGWKLLVKNRVVPIRSGGFKLILPIYRARMRFILRAISAFGEVEQETYEVFVPDEVPKPPFKFQWIPSVGWTKVTYQQAYVPTVDPTQKTTKIDSQNLTGKFSLAAARPGSKWDFGASTYFTIYPVVSTATESSSINTGGTTIPTKIWFVGVNLRTGYAIVFGNSPWRLTLMGGFYWASTYTMGEPAAGYQNESGPQLFPVLRYAMSNGGMIGVYAKFSPIAKGFGFMDFGNREIATGMSWNRVLKSGHPFSISADLALLNLSNTDDVNIRSTNYSLSVGYGL